MFLYPSSHYDLGQMNRLANAHFEQWLFAASRTLPIIASRSNKTYGDDRHAARMGPGIKLNSG